MRRGNRNKKKTKGSMIKLAVASLGAIFIVSFSVSYLLLNSDTASKEKEEKKALETKESSTAKEDTAIEISKEESKEVLKEKLNEEKEVAQTVNSVTPIDKPVEKPVEKPKPVQESKPVEQPKICGFQGCKLQVGHKPGHDDPIQNWCTQEGCDLLEGQDDHTHDSEVPLLPPSDESTCEYPGCNLEECNIPEHEIEVSDDTETEDN